MQTGASLRRDRDDLYEARIGGAHAADEREHQHAVLVDLILERRVRSLVRRVSIPISGARRALLLVDEIIGIEESLVGAVGVADTGPRCLPTMIGTRARRF